jgi:hypothetical protein
LETLTWTQLISFSFWYKNAARATHE